MLDAFLTALRENPGDEVTWLAAADWLEESGKEPRAELVRLIRRLRALPVMRRTKAKAALEDRVAALLRGGALPLVPELVNGVGMRMALIPPGRFRMGSPMTEEWRHAGERLHEVEITRPFYLGVFPVTQGQYAAVMGVNPSHFHAGGDGAEHVEGMDTTDFPIESVTWEDAARFCRRLSKAEGGRKAGRAYRLPSEAEWEYACRGGSASSTTFHMGDVLRTTEANFDGEYDRERDGGGYLQRTSKAGSYAPNAFGLYDMHGNVWEWCQDWFEGGYYAESPRQDPPGPASGTGRVSRGGCWDAVPLACRAAYRIGSDARHEETYTGFRVAMSFS